LLPKAFSQIEVKVETKTTIKQCSELEVICLIYAPMASQAAEVKSSTTLQLDHSNLGAYQAADKWDQQL
jgi:hypothetical protein